MMRLIVKGEPYVYTHHCTGSERNGDMMSMDVVQRFLVETLYESFRQCGSNIMKVDDSSWKYSRTGKPGFLRGVFSSLKQQPDLIYRMDGDSHDTWLYVMPNKDDLSLIDTKFIAKSVEKRSILPVLVVGDLWCFETNGQNNICGATYAAKYETI